MKFNLQGCFQHVSLSDKILKDILINQIVKGEILVEEVWKKKQNKTTNKQKKQAEERDFEKSERWGKG